MTDGGSPGFDNNSLDYVNKLRELQITVGGSPGYDNNYLDYVNKLREFWHKHQNAVVIDDQVS
jgi:hypothetical protein